MSKDTEGKSSRKRGEAMRNLVCKPCADKAVKVKAGNTGERTMQSS